MPQFPQQFDHPRHPAPMLRPNLRRLPRLFQRMAAGTSVYMAARGEPQEIEVLEAWVLAFRK